MSARTTTPKPKPRPKRTRGFMCPTCGVPLHVEHTKTVAAAVIRRYRVCPQCDYLLPTEERPRSAASPPVG